MKHPLPPTLRRTHLYATTLSLVFILAAIPAAAQTADQHSHHGNQAQATLHIEARVVSYAMTPKHHDGDGDDVSVSYNLSSALPAMSVREEIREFVATGSMLGSQDRAPQLAVLKTLTVVPQ